MKAVLFLCTGNSCRSQMAEAFARAMAPPRVQVYSAGTKPVGIHPHAIKVMEELGLSLETHRSKSLEEIPLTEIDTLITLCGSAAESCPSIPGVAPMHWPLEDPADAKGSEAEILRTFREVRDEIQARVRSLYADA